MPTETQKTMKIRIAGELVDRQVAHITRSIREDGSVREHPEPLLYESEVVFRPDDNPAPIIVTRTIPA
ncbi:hypothetical protein PS627_00103 [Pseudomonas fluorescens]|uniref:hypothetical protein n=1 Tax=Pseudomonas fluorescens TaxID=294 RepID=UPI00125C9DB7|nr:hypothetical protein [Pseudomonas fluorescens]CAG8863167.1 hypothetical protein PS627_00103 [Pseudomonas fluorescens]